jgi:hypothetical protein
VEVAAFVNNVVAVATVIMVMQWWYLLLLVLVLALLILPQLLFPLLFILVSCFDDFDVSFSYLD